MAEQEDYDIQVIQKDQKTNREILMLVGNQKEKYSKQMAFINILLILLLTSCNGGSKENVKIDSKTTKESKEVSFIKKNDTIKPIDTLKLYEKRLVGEIILSKNKWYLVSGRSCEQCDENVSIYLFPEKPQFLTSKNTIKSTDRFDYPGKVFHYEDNSLIYESSTFFGKCLDEFDNVVIWVDRSLNDSNKWEESLYMIQIFNDKAIENRPKLEMTLLEQIDKHISNGGCFEIEGKDQISEP